ncbi:PA2169 family four-helix-bundle protein [Tamlana sp. 62-3]|uniref:PA2169 family four-helix-bundle protein n=1 Tax=Neotamlana sargassicola TaxID=2883125 RepID=A0A9X1L5S0_9FLAO|nr:PA2169 family four-helix-bundle protein [Tamlana sargassicola]
MKKILGQLNDLLLVNFEVEKVYDEIVDEVKDDTLRRFFRESAIERNEFSKLINKEIESLGETPERVGALSKNFYKLKTKFKGLLDVENESKLIDEIFMLKQASVNKYNEVLMQPHLPLKVCKTLVKQRDSIQDTLRVFKREYAIVA